MKNFSEKNLGKLIQRTLQAGVSASLLLFFLGILFRFYGGGTRADKTLAAGVVVLLLTPVTRVAMLIYGYWRTKEYKFSIAALIVLTLLLASIFRKG